MSIIASEVKHGATYYDVEFDVLETDPFNCVSFKVFSRQMRGQPCGKLPQPFDGQIRFINCKNLVPTFQKINKVSTRTTSSVEYTHSRNHSPLQQLIKQVDVYTAKPLLQVNQSLHDSLFLNLWCARGSPSFHRDSSVRCLSAVAHD